MTSNIFVHFLFTQALRAVRGRYRFVNTYENIGAINILMNAEIHIHFLLGAVYTQSLSAHVSLMRPIVSIL